MLTPSLTSPLALTDSEHPAGPQVAEMLLSHSLCGRGSLTSAASTPQQMSLLGQLTSFLLRKSPPQASPVYNLPPVLCLPGRSYGTYKHSIHVYQIIEGRIRMQKDPSQHKSGDNVGLDRICVSLSWV